MAPITIVVVPQLHSVDGPLKGAFSSLLEAALTPGAAVWARDDNTVKVLAAGGDKLPPRNFVKASEALASATGIGVEEVKKAFSEADSIDASNRAKVAKVALRLTVTAQALRAADCDEQVKLLPRLTAHETLFQGPAVSGKGTDDDPTDVDSMSLPQVNAALKDPARFSAALLARRAALTKEGSTDRVDTARADFEKALEALDVDKASSKELEIVSKLKMKLQEAIEAANSQEKSSPSGSGTAPATDSSVATMAAAMVEMVKGMPKIVASAIAAASATTIDDEDDVQGKPGGGNGAAKRRKIMIESDGRTGLSTYMQSSIISPRLRKSLIEGSVDVDLVTVAEGLNGFSGSNGTGSKKGFFQQASTSAADGKMELIAVESDIKDTLAPAIRLQAFFHLIEAIEVLDPDIGIGEYRKVIMSLMVKYDAPAVWTYDRQARFAMANQLRDNVANPTERDFIPRMTLDDSMFKTVFNGIAAIRCVFCSSKSHWSGEHTAKAAELEKKKAPTDSSSAAPNPHGACTSWNDVFRTGVARTGKFRKGCTMKICPYEHRCFKCGGRHTVSNCP